MVLLVGDVDTSARVEGDPDRVVKVRRHTAEHRVAPVVGRYRDDAVSSVVDDEERPVGGEGRAGRSNEARREDAERLLAYRVDAVTRVLGDVQQVALRTNRESFGRPQSRLGQRASRSTNPWISGESGGRPTRPDG